MHRLQKEIFISAGVPRIHRGQFSFRVALLRCNLGPKTAQDLEREMAEYWFKAGKGPHPETDNLKSTTMKYLCHHLGILFQFSLILSKRAKTF